MRTLPPDRCEGPARGHWRATLSRTLNVFRLWNATRYSIAGLREAIRHHAAVRQELLAGIVLVPAAIVLGSSGIERAFLLSSLILVLMVELLNTAVETVVDRVGTENNELSDGPRTLAPPRSSWR